jgi:hypothetical protein
MGGMYESIPVHHPQDIPAGGFFCCSSSGQRVFMGV